MRSIALAVALLATAQSVAVANAGEPWAIFYGFRSDTNGKNDIRVGGAYDNEDQAKQECARLNGKNKSIYTVFTVRHCNGSPIPPEQSSPPVAPSKTTEMELPEVISGDFGGGRVDYFLQPNGKLLAVNPATGERLATGTWRKGAVKGQVILDTESYRYSFLGTGTPIVFVRVAKDDLSDAQTARNVTAKGNWTNN